jgi:hypothetical protein
MRDADIKKEAKAREFLQESFSLIIIVYGEVRSVEPAICVILF